MRGFVAPIHGLSSDQAGQQLSARLWNCWVPRAVLHRHSSQYLLEP